MFEKIIQFLLRKKILHNFEPVTIYSFDQKESIKIMAKVDTGADRTSIDKVAAEQLGLLNKKNIVEIKFVHSGLGRQERKIVNLKYQIKGRVISTQASVTDRTHLKYPMLIGVKDIGGFLVDPDRKHLS